jgi:hypothetical protein
MCVQWPQFNQEVSSLCTIHVRRYANTEDTTKNMLFKLISNSYDLPADVFGPGEKRPAKTKKTKSKGKGMRAPSTANGGSQPSPATNGTTPSSTPASKKRALDLEVGPISIQECVKQWSFVSHAILASEGIPVTRKAFVKPLFHPLAPYNLT